MRARIIRDKKYSDVLFNKIIVLQEVLDIYLKTTISKLNKRMVEQSDLLIAVLQHGFGGAHVTMKYEKKDRPQ